jgi:hypothetical protein
MPTVNRPCECPFLTYLRIGAPEEGFWCSSCSLLLHSFASLPANRCCLESKIKGMGPTLSLVHPVGSWAACPGWIWLGEIGGRLAYLLLWDATRARSHIVRPLGRMPLGRPLRSQEQPRAWRHVRAFAGVCGRVRAFAKYTLVEVSCITLLFNSMHIILNMTAIQHQCSINIPFSVVFCATLL